MDKYEGKEIIINSPSSVLFTSFSDLTLFSERIPAEYREKVTVTKDSVSGDINGMNMGLEVIERIPNSKVIMKPQAGFPIDFSLVFDLKDVNISQTAVKISVETNMNFLTRAMFGGKIQQIVDKISDQIAKGIANQSFGEGTFNEGLKDAINGNLKDVV